MDFKHISVLFDETIDLLNIKNGGIYVDATLGGGGHSYGILNRGKDIKLIGIDQDAEAIMAAKNRLSEFGENVIYVNRNFRHITEILKELSIEEIDGAVMDLGVSSYQLDNGDRGFSYMQNAPLDMRMDTRATKSAFEVINNYSMDELTNIFYSYGEEKWSKRIAGFIVDRRKTKPIETTFELVDIIKAAIPKAARMDGGHPAKRIFQAVRIEVNEELSLLSNAIEDFVYSLKPGGRLAVITFHSLEDRITKTVFNKLAKCCICPVEFPVCICNHKSMVKIVNRKAIVSGEKELEDNARAQSAKLRVVERL